MPELLAPKIVKEKADKKKKPLLLETKSMRRFQERVSKPMPAHARTRMGNKKIILPKVDERTHKIRRAKELYYSIVHDLGGLGNLSTIQDHLCRDLAFLMVEGEELQRQLVKGEGTSTRELYLIYLRSAGQLVRMLGLKKMRQKDLDKMAKGRDKGEESEEGETLEEYITKEERREKRMKSKKAINTSFKRMIGE